MTREEQDILWKHLSDESREIIIQDYLEEKKYSYDYCESEDDADGFSTGVTRTLEKIFGKHNILPEDELDEFLRTWCPHCYSMFKNDMNKHDLNTITDGLLRCNLDLMLLEHPSASKLLLDKFTKRELFEKYKEFLKTRRK